jgi:hypothetical protein
MSSNDFTSTSFEDSNESEGTILGLRISTSNEASVLGPPTMETPPSDMKLGCLRNRDGGSLSPCHDKKRKRESMMNSSRGVDEEELTIREMMQIFGITRLCSRDRSISKKENLWTRRKRTALSESKGDIQALSVSVGGAETILHKQEKPSNGRNRRRLHSSGSFRYV